MSLLSHELCPVFCCCFFFFQAEDGIRDYKVTGDQTCALPMCISAGVPAEMHIYERGPHGVGLAPTDAVLASWAGRLKDWLEIRGLLHEQRAVLSGSAQGRRAGRDAH